MSFNESGGEAFSEGDCRGGYREASKGGGGYADGRKVMEVVVDEAIEKRDPELDEREQRLLGCIVDPIPCPLTCIVSLPFESSRRNIRQHLRASAPPHTIDSIRSIVSLPSTPGTVSSNGTGSLDVYCLDLQGRGKY